MAAVVGAWPIGLHRHWGNACDQFHRGGDTAQILASGTSAPDFTFRVTADQNLSLQDLAGRPVILAFYPADWSPVCGDQMALYNEVLPEFHKAGAELLGISVDSTWCHEAFAKDRHLHFPLLADFHPKGKVASSYGAYRKAEGVCERALFVINRQGVIFWSYLSPIAVNPGADGILDALEKLPKMVNGLGHVESASHVG
jgi:peroxiredoxin